MNKGHDFGADCWSLGVLIFELLTGKSVRNGSPTSKFIQYVSIGWATEKCCKNACYNCVICVHILMSTHPSIHLICLLPLSNFLSGNGLWGQQQPQQGDFLHPRYFGQLLSKIPKPLSGQQRDIVSLKCPGSSRGPSTRACPEYLTREASRRHLN